MESEAQKFIRLQRWTSEPPAGCRWKVGDEVLSTNEYGVTFGPFYVLGFTLPGDELHGRTIYIDSDCAWFPCLPEQLSVPPEILPEGLSPTTGVVLKAA